MTGRWWPSETQVPMLPMSATHPSSSPQVFTPSALRLGMVQPAAQGWRGAFGYAGNVGNLVVNLGRGSRALSLRAAKPACTLSMPAAPATVVPSSNISAAFATCDRSFGKSIKPETFP